jgi:hypothetical protein
MLLHPLSVRMAPEGKVTRPAAAMRFVCLSVLLPIAFFFLLRWLRARAMPPPPGAVFFLRMGDADWFVVATLLGVSTAALIVLLSGARDSRGMRRGMVLVEGLLIAACALGPSALLAARSLRYSLSLTSSEFVYRPLLSLNDRRYPYSAIRHVLLVRDPGAEGRGEHLRIEFEDGYRFSTRRFRASVPPADVAWMAQFVSAQSGLPVEEARTSGP